MREILFRGKRVHTTEWVYGSLIHVDDYCCILEADCEDYGVTYLNGELGFIDGTAIPVDPETVGQYTGVDDRTGTKIFEGDILDYPRWIVSYLGSSGGEALGMNAGWYTQRDNFESWGELECNGEHLVLGNIYDNPELIRRQSYDQT